MSVQEFNLHEYEYVVDESTNTLKVIKSEMTAAHWVRDMYRRYLDNPDVTCAYCEQWTYVMDNKGRVGKACRDERDDFDPQIGIAIAYARLYDLPIHPDFLSKKAAPHKTRFEVGETVQGWDGSYGRVTDICLNELLTKYKVKWYNSTVTNWYFSTDLKKVD